MTDKIAVYLPGLHPGGAQRVALDLCGELADHSEVLLVVGDVRGPLRSQVPEDVRLVDLSVTRAVLTPPKLIKFLRAERPNTLLSFLEHGHVAAALATRISGWEGRLVLSLQNTVSQVSADTGSRRAQIVARALPYACRAADGVVAVSEGVRDDLQQHWVLRSSRIEVIYNPIDPDRLHRLARAGTPVSTGAASTPLIVASGRLVPQKDFDTLLRSFAQVVESLDAQLVILGEGPLRGELEQLVSALSLGDRVSLPGFVENPYPTVASADLFVLSSKYEGCPVALVEAVTLGVPCVATDCPSGPREILGPGKHLVPVGDVGALATTVSTALRDGSLRKQTTGASVERFALANVANRYAEILS